MLTESQRYPSFCLGHTRPDTCFGQATNLMESHNSRAIRLLPSGRYLAHTQCYHLIDMDVSSCKFRAGRPPARRFDHQPFGDALVRRKERAQVYKIDPPEAGKRVIKRSGGKEKSPESVSATWPAGAVTATRRTESSNGSTANDCRRREQQKRGNNSEQP